MVMTYKISQTCLHKVVINMRFSKNDLRLKEPQKIKKIIKKQSISKK